MKVGIMTWYFGANYGAKAQAYALMNVIESFGIKSYLINYRAKGHMALNVKMNLNVKQKKRHPILCLRCLLRCGKFEKTNNIYRKTKKLQDVSEIDALGLDCIVFGSDAIFNVRHKSFEEVYMGVGIENTAKISYAPSCEFLEVDYQLSDACIRSLKQFKALSVRDRNTQQIIENNTGYQPVRVLDPTFLYNFEDVTSNWREKDYLLVYCFSAWDEYAAQIKEFAKANNLKIIAIGRYCNWADESYDAASFAEWICSFRNAKYVITDSFHGTVFSIKNHKELILCSRDDKREKIRSILQDAGIERDFYTGEETIQHYLERTPIGYDSVDNNLKIMIEASRNYLKNSLQSIDDMRR